MIVAWRISIEQIMIASAEDESHEERVRVDEVERWEGEGGVGGRGEGKGEGRRGGGEVSSLELLGVIIFREICFQQKLLESLRWGPLTGCGAFPTESFLSVF